MNNTYWYRAEGVQYAAPLDEFDEPMGSGEVGIQWREFVVVKTTPKGVWLAPWYDTYSTGLRRFVLINARKKFANPTREDALISLIARKDRQRQILSAQLRTAERITTLAKQELIHLSITDIK